MKMQFCDECANHRFQKVAEVVCTLDHKPRFYMPKNDNPHDQNYGWKRRCEDFKAMTGAKVL